MRLKKTYLVVGALAVLLILVRIALPYLVKNYVNKTLDELPGYTGHVEDIDLSLYRGAYKIKGLQLQEEKGNPKYPFLNIDETDLSLEWRSLFKGKLVGEVIMVRPRMNIVAATAATDTTQEASQDDWTEVVKDLMPITINRFEVQNGRFAYLDFTSEPHIDMHIEDMQLVALNLANVEEAGKKLPSPVNFSGKSIGGGMLKGEMQANLLKEIPDFDMKAELTGVDLTSVNDFIEAYGKFDVERGRLDMYSELKLTDGKYDGYVKPFFEDLKVLNWKKDKEENGVLRAAWEAVAGLFVEAAENQKRDQIATKVPIKGDVNQPDTDVFKTVVNVLRHAFIDAFNKGIESRLTGSGSSEEEDEKK